LNQWKTHTADTALVEPLAVGWHAVRTHVPHGCSSALVVGAGPIGLAIVQALRAHGVEIIIVADTNPAKKDHASRAGAHHFINSLEKDVVQSCVKLAPGRAGVQFAFDTAGKQATLDQCVCSLRVGGTVVNVAIWGGSALIVPNAFTLGEKKYSGSAVYVERDFDEVVSAISRGKFELLRLHKYTRLRC
jgi:threonine dehydrogenase-like Zn-dependent dehydrogenase